MTRRKQLLKTQWILRRICLALFVIAIFQPVIAWAESKIEPELTVGARYDTNPRYFSEDSQNIESASGLLVDVRLPLTHTTPRSTSTLRPRIQRSFYRKEINQDLEDKDYYLPANLTWMTSRSSTGAAFGYSNLSLRTSELASPDNPGGGSGTVFSNKDKQERWYFDPNWQYRFSQKNSISLNGAYQSVHYTDRGSATRFDYDYTSTSAAYNHSLTERHSLSLRATWAKYDSENSDLRTTNDSETNSLSLIYQYAVSETTSLAADLGWARTKGEVIRPNSRDPIDGLVCNPALIVVFPCEIQSDSSNFVGNISITKRTESLKYFLQFGQTITPNSNGAEVLRFNVDGSIRKKFTKRFWVELDVLAYNQQNIGDSAQDFNRDFVRTSARLNYNMTRTWAVVALYRFTWSRQDDILRPDARTADNHQFLLGFKYTPTGWRW